MSEFDPFSDEGQLWLETREVEEEHDYIENLGNNLTRIHLSKNVKIRYNPVSNQKEKQHLAKKGLHLFNMSL
tara:strand:+ start:96 stop:311 length:216 start_codon:yes stop_codon:yes gene_type:complete